MTSRGSSIFREALFLTERQAAILEFVRAYVALVREPCSARLVARRFERHEQTIRDHFAALHRKGWLKTRSSPALPRDETDRPRGFLRSR